MSAIYNITNPWRTVLLSEPASFARVMFHVESGGRTSGRRTVEHEYPKRDLPYAEDMGRHAVRFQFSGYLVYKPFNGPSAPPTVRYNYVEQRNLLYAALEKPDADWLRHPVFAPGGILVMCERYTMTESRERGGYTQFEMQFVEAGQPVLATGVAVNTRANVSSVASAVETSLKALMTAMSGL